jgi:hypothetical protein
MMIAWTTNNKFTIRELGYDTSFIEVTAYCFNCTTNKINNSNKKGKKELDCFNCKNIHTVEAMTKCSNCKTKISLEAYIYDKAFKLYDNVNEVKYLCEKCRNILLNGFE